MEPLAQLFYNLDGGKFPHPHCNDSSPKNPLQDPLSDELTAIEILEEARHFFVATTQQFASLRSQQHIAEIIRSHAKIHRLLIKSVDEGVKIQLFQSSLHVSTGSKKVLSCVLGLRSLSQNEHFDERHLRQAFQRCVPQADIVPDSFYAYRYANDGALSVYAEIEKQNLLEWTSDEIAHLQRNIEDEVLISIEQVSTHTDIPQNEEETLRTILLLSSQLQKAKDLPQVMIHYRGQTEETLIFHVTLVRRIEKGKENAFTLPKLPHICNIIPLKNAIVGSLRSKQKKQALCFLTHCSKAPFLRCNRSIDFLKARHTIVASLQTALGRIRDMNGGLFYQQQHLLEKLKTLLSDDECSELYVVENLFHTLTPCILKNMIGMEHMLTFFRQYQILKKNALNRQEPLFLSEKHLKEAFVGFICPNGFYTEEIVLLKNHLCLEDHNLGICTTRFARDIFGFAVCFSDDATIQERFVEYSKGLVEGAKRRVAHLYLK